MRIMADLSRGEGVHQNPVSLMIMRKSDSIIEVSRENGQYGRGRTKTDRISEDTFNAQNTSQFPKNIFLVIFLYAHDAVEGNAYIRYSEAITYIIALPVLNLPPVFRGKDYNEDVIIQHLLTISVACIPGLVMVSIVLG